MHLAGEYPEWPALACRSAHWLSAFACKNRFEPLLSADPNQPVNIAAGRCTPERSCGCCVGYHMIYPYIDRATRVTAKTPPRQSGCASKNKEWRRSLNRRKSHPRPVADSAEILPSNTVTRSCLRALAVPAIPCSPGSSCVRHSVYNVHVGEFSMYPLRAAMPVAFCANDAARLRRPSRPTSARARRPHLRVRPLRLFSLSACCYSWYVLRDRASRSTRSRLHRRCPRSSANASGRHMRRLPAGALAR
jgi:hypothetical protein